MTRRGVNSSTIGCLPFGAGANPVAGLYQGDMMYTPKQILNEISVSILVADISSFDNNNAPDATTCQDIIHSIYKTYSNLKSISVSIDKDCVGIALLRYIASDIRPFQLKWHSKFFRNRSFRGNVVTTTPIDNVPTETRVHFLESFRILQDKTRLFVKEINKEYQKGMGRGVL